MVTSVKKMVAQQVLIPAAQAGVMALVGAAAGHYVSLWWKVPADVTIPAGALAAGGYWLMVHMDKNSRFPSAVGRALSRLTRSFGSTASIPANFFDVEGTNTTILLQTKDTGQGEWFRLAGVDPRRMRRIAFHVCFMGGRLSHDYLDTKTNLLSRAGVIRLQQELVKNNLAVLRNERRANRGIALNEKGADCLLELARTYRPTPFERRAAVPYLKKWDVTYMLKSYIKAKGGGIYGND